MKNIRVAVIGVGNCAKSLIEGVAQATEFRSKGLEVPGLGFQDIGGYGPENIEFVLAYDIDSRKTGKRLQDAIYANPNCAWDIPLKSEASLEKVCGGVIVQTGRLLDGVAPHMEQYPENEGFRIDTKSFQCTREGFIHALKSAKVDVLLNYLPVGSDEATRFYLEAAIAAGVPFVNCIPEFIVSDEVWQKKLIDAKLPAIGDDMRSQIGASIISAVLHELFLKRGADVTVHYQDNVGGNTDFLNMQDQSRLASKKISKENVIRKQDEIAGRETKKDSIAAGPAKYFPALGDNKRASWLIKGTIFGGAPFEFTADLSCQDSPNSAGVVIDAIRYLQVAREIGIIGPLIGPSAWTQKTPPIDLRPGDAYHECESLAAREVPNGYLFGTSMTEYVHKSVLDMLKTEELA
jgi:myo-inositol-1-phosphate synthase